MKIKPLLTATLAVATLATGCKQSNPATENEINNDTNSLSVTQQLQNVKDVATNVWQKTKDTTTNAWADLKDSLQSTKDYSYDQKDAFVASASADLAALDQKIKNFSDKADAASDSAKADAQAKLQDLRDKRAVLDKKLDDLKNSAEANWNDAKTGFENSYEDAKNSLKQAWQWLSDKSS